MGILRQFFTPSLLTGAVFFLSAGSAFAVPKDEEPVSIKIRAIRGDQELSKSEFEEVERTIDISLSDIGPKLKELPYKNYHLVSSRIVSVPLKRKETFSLSGGQHVTVRPLGTDNGRVCLWIHWEDENGQKILDSRLHFNQGETMLAGTDHEESSGWVIAVQAERP